MKDLGRVRGSKASAVPMWECEDCIYINTNIVKVETEEGREEEYEYDCVQYSRAEYNELRLANVELAVAELGGAS